MISVLPVCTKFVSILHATSCTCKNILRNLYGLVRMAGQPKRVDRYIRHILKRRGYKINFISLFPHTALECKRCVSFADKIFRPKFFAFCS